MVTFEQIVADALALRPSGDATAVARWIQEALHEAGYAIHSVHDGRCVRVGEPPGRPMTQDEMILLGLSQLEGG